MGPIGAILENQMAAIVVHEALDEMRGRSNKRWALVILGLLLGAAIAGWVMRHRQQQIDTYDIPDDAATIHLRNA